MSPAVLNAGAPDTTLSVTGTGFVATSVVELGTYAEATTYVSSTELTAVVPASRLASGATLSLTVSNGTETSSPAAASLTVNNPAPVMSQLSPLSVPAGSPGAQLTVAGTGFVPTTSLQVNGAARSTTYVSATQITATLNAADLLAPGTLQVSAVNSTPGGGSSPSLALLVVSPSNAPVIQAVSPSPIIAGSPQTTVSILASGLTSMSSAQWNQAPLSSALAYCSIGSSSGLCLQATVPASLLAAPGTASVTVTTPTATPPVSTPVSLSITDPPVPTLAGLSMTAAPVNTSFSVSASGTGFTTQSVLVFNGISAPTTLLSSTQLTAQVPASSLPGTGLFPVTVTTPAPGGGTSSAIPFTVYVPLPNNSMAYNPANGLFYLSVPSAAGTPYGNSIVSIDPVTGTLGTPVPIGSEPNRLAITADGRSLWVALDGAAAVRRLDLTTNTADPPFAIGSGNSTEMVSALAALPGSPDSVVVSTFGNAGTMPTGGTLSIYDSGVQRPSVITFGTYDPFPWALLVDGSTGEIYGPGDVFAGYYYNTYSYSSTGVVSKSSTFSTLLYASNNTDDVQIANGLLYTSTGQVVDPETGALVSTFSDSTGLTVEGSTTVDTALGKAFILASGGAYGGNPAGLDATQLYSFSAANNALLASIPITLPLYQPSYQYNGPTGARLTRWGSDGLAMRSTGGFISLHTALVQDLSTTDADLAVSLAAPPSGSTGSTSTYTATVTNRGPVPATAVSLSAVLPLTGVLSSVTSSAGSCSASPALCDLGILASGGSATATFSLLQTTAGTQSLTVRASGSEADPVPDNNVATASTTIVGAEWNLVPTLSALSPAAIAMGSSDTVITLTGSNFSASSVVLLNGTPLPTGYTSATELTATVPAASLASLGWSAVSIQSPAPGGGLSTTLPLTVFAELSLGANDILYDPYSRDILAALGTGSATVLGNSIVSIAPSTGSVSTPVPLSGTPSRLALSSDGQLLYALVPSASTGTIAGFDMLSRQLSFVVSGFEASGYNEGVTDIAVQPGGSDTIAVDEGPYVGVSIYDIDPAAQTATRRGAAIGTYNDGCLGFPTASTLFITGSTLSIYSVTANGLLNGSYPYDQTVVLQELGCSKLDGGLLEGQGGEPRFHPAHAAWSLRGFNAAGHRERGRAGLRAGRLAGDGVCSARPELILDRPGHHPQLQSAELSADQLPLGSVFGL